MEAASANADRATRVSVACTSCRIKRIRCDGVEPCCQQCLDRGIECKYTYSENKRKPPSKRLVESLQARIRVLEEEVANLQRGSHPLARGQVSSNHEEQNRLKLLGNDTQHDNPDRINEITNTFGRLKVDSDGQIRFFAGQSNFNLLPNQLLYDSCGVGPPLTSTHLLYEAQIPQELQQHLLDLFFRWQNPWLYMIEKESFLRDFESGNRRRYCTPLLLLAIFALASRFSDRLEVRTDVERADTAGNAFADQARRTLMGECDRPTVATAQAAALISLRCIAENKEPAGWVHSGIATRIAFNLGLNLDPTALYTAGTISQDDMTVRQIAWWGLYNLDKLFCLGLGRTMSIADTHSTCPRPNIHAAAELEPWDVDNGLKPHSRIVSMAHTVSEQLRIATRAIDIIYSPNHGLTRPELCALASDADVKLNTFWTALPSHLRIPPGTKPPALPHVYHMHIQYHVTQILLHRPFVAYHAEDEVQSPQTNSADQWSICAASASQIVKYLKVFDTHYGLRFAVVGTVCHTFTAAVIHVIDASSSNPQTQARGRQNLDFCFKALEQMSIPWSWSFQVLRALRTLCRHWLPGQGFDGSHSDDQTNTDGGSQRSSEVYSSQFEPSLPSFEDIMASHGTGLDFRALWNLSPSMADFPFVQ